MQLLARNITIAKLYILAHKNAQSKRLFTWQNLAECRERERDNIDVNRRLCKFDMQYNHPKYTESQKSRLFHVSYLSNLGRSIAVTSQRHSSIPAGEPIVDDVFLS